jgi:hypothetical protein
MPTAVKLAEMLDAFSPHFRGTGYPWERKGTARSLPNAASAMWLTDLSSHLVSSRQTSITVFYRFYTVISQGVPLGRGISISGYGLSYLITFSGVWGGLSQREICQ